MKEQWRDVPGYEGLYQISIDTKEGRCRSLNYHLTGKTKLLSNKVNKRYKRIYWDLRNEEKRTYYQAARWIAITYPELVENEYFEGAEIDHINTDTMDNRPCNLRWVTRTGNMNNPLTKKHLSKTHTGIMINHPAYSKNVYQYSKDGIFIAVYPSVMEAYRQTGISFRHISKCCLGKKYKSVGGYIWRYAS